MKDQVYLYITQNFRHCIGGSNATWKMKNERFISIHDGGGGVLKLEKDPFKLQLCLFCPHKGFSLCPGLHKYNSSTVLVDLGPLFDQDP